MLFLTDDGHGVGISNYEQRFRNAELARIQNSDYRIKIHRSREDSGQNEAERTNSAIGDAIVDGGTLNWEIFKRFEDVTQKEKLKMNFDEFCKYEEKRMAKNAWAVAKEIRDRLDDAPVMGEYVKSFLAEEDDRGFFHSHDHLKLFIDNRNKKQQQNVPGYYHFKNIELFINNHYQIGELYQEFIKEGCKKNNWRYFATFVALVHG